MSIATVVTEGYGSFGSVNLIITEGYSQASAASSSHDGGDGFTRQEIARQSAARSRRRLDGLTQQDAETLEAILERVQEMRAEQQDFEEPQVEEALAEVEEAAVALTEKIETTRAVSKFSPYERRENRGFEIADLSREISDLKAKLDRVIHDKMLADEDEMLILLLAH